MEESMRTLTENCWRSTALTVILAAAVCRSVAQTWGGPVRSRSGAPVPSTEQRTGWPGLPPDCWTEPRLYHESESKYDWRAWTTIERVQLSSPDAKTLSPNGAYYF